MTQKKYIAEIIGQEYKEWHNEGIILSSGTGGGKTTFACDILIPYALEQGKNVLYLTNRKPSYEQIMERIKNYPNVKLMTYQLLQSLIRKDETLPHFDFIIADEAHYFHTDGLFNEYTDLSYDWLVNQKDCVVVYMSATGDALFPGLILSGIVMPNRKYVIPKDYSYIDAVYFYDKSQITEIINNILSQNPDDKILVFVNSLKRLKEMHCIYGDKAYYLASKSNVKDKSLSFIDYDCINDMQYSKRILFTTKALDNGFDLKDKAIRHIFCEIIDVDSCIQSIGRKRSQDEKDTCSVYFMRYSNRAIRQFANHEEQSLIPVQKLMNDYDSFLEEYRHDRDLLRRNRILFGEMEEDSESLGKIRINHRARMKFERDVQIYHKMLSDGYEKVLLSFLGDDFKRKVKELQIETTRKDLFLEYLQTICGEKLFKDQQKTLKDKFRIILGLKDRHMGINTLCGKLKDCGYPYYIISKKETKEENRNKRYWCVLRQ